MQFKGKNLIRVTSILFLIFGVISTVTSLLATTLAGIFVGNTSGGLQAGGMVITGLFVAYLIFSVFEICVGIIGLKNSQNPEKAKTLVILGIVLIIISIINSIWSIIGQELNTQFIISMIMGIILPILFICGAKQNQKS